MRIRRINRLAMEASISAALFLAAILAMGAPGVQAAPLDEKQVAADATWLGHVDFDAVRSSTIVRHMYERAKEKHPGMEDKMKMATQMLGMDPRHDLHGATFYGKQVGKETGVMILDAKLDQQRLLDWGSKAPGHESAKHGDRELHSWPRPDRSHATVVAATFDDNHLVVASSFDELRAALDVLDGKARSLADSSKGEGSKGEGSKLSGIVPPGTTMLFRVIGVSKAELPCKDSVARQTESFRMVTGENEGKSFFRVRVTMTTDEAAAQMVQVAEGAKAMASLKCADDASCKKLVEPVRIEREGKSLIVLWKAPADDVWAFIKDHEQCLEQLAAMHRRHHEHEHAKQGAKPGEKHAGAKEKSAGGSGEKAKPAREEDF